MPKPSKFAEYFAEPRDFGEGCWVVSREAGETREEVARVFTEFFQIYYSDPFYAQVSPSRISESTVRFRLVGRDEIDDWDTRQVEGRCAVWCLGEAGHGAKKVWVLER
jgi:hypothetical protein